MAIIFAFAAFATLALALFERRVNLRCADGGQSHISLFALAAVLIAVSWAEHADYADRRDPEIGRGANGCVHGGLDELTMAALRSAPGEPLWLCRGRT